jgi:hypothetical protein
MRASLPIVLALLPLVLVSDLFADDTDEGERGSVWSSIDLQLYGYVKLDSAWDTGEAVPGDFVKWINLDPADADDAQFNMTVNETRVGLNIGGVEEDDESLQASGRIEIDFYGGGGGSSPQPRLRQAFVDLVWPRSKFSLLAGQTSDVISPLFPRTLNYPVAWWAGNIGFRRPQLRIRKAVGVGAASDFLVTAAITKDIGSTQSVFASVDSGADSALPGLQLHLGWVKKNRQAGPVSVGVSGHYAVEQFEVDMDGSTEDFDSWSANFDVEIPVTEKVRVKSELFVGENLAPYLGGIGQGVNLERMIEIGSKGGWISLELGPFSNLSYHLGLSTDRVDEEDIEIGDRSRNSSIFANGIWSLSRHVDLGLELSYWETRYKAEGEADNIRTQFAVVYRF